MRKENMSPLEVGMEYSYCKELFEYNMGLMKEALNLEHSKVH